MSFRDDGKALNRLIMVVSRHPPCSQKARIPANARKLGGLASGTHLLENDKVIFSFARLRIFGHSHFCTEFCEGGAQRVSN